jgi:hypothetical protein
MKKPSWIRVPLAASAISLVTAACHTETPTSAVIENAYPTADDASDASKQTTVLKAWWATTLFLDPVPPGAASGLQRTVPDSDFAYAVLAPGWDPASTMPPTRLIPVRSAAKLAVRRGDTLDIAVSDLTFVGDCRAGKALSQDEADFITQRIFPGEFSGLQYDAKSCTSMPLERDAGTADAGDTPIEAGSADAGDGG